MRLSDFSRTLYDTHPKSAILYHYTSLGAFQKILDTGKLWLSDIRYFNDTSEIAYAVTQIQRAVRIAHPGILPDGSIDTDRLLTRAVDKWVLNPQAMNFVSWLCDRLSGEMALYVGAFTEEGNLLSQWRGYCPTNRGVSIGFRYTDLRRVAQDQVFDLGQCQYSTDVQADAMRQIAKSLEEAIPPDLHPPDFARVASAFEGDVLRIAALIKNPLFKEEKEWRVVTPYCASYGPEIALKYRQGKSMLIPYREFELPRNENRQLLIERVYVGPTLHPNQSVNSVSNLLYRHGARASSGTGPGVWNSQVPLREP